MILDSKQKKLGVEVASASVRDNEVDVVLYKDLTDDDRQKLDRAIETASPKQRSSGEPRYTIGEIKIM